MSSSSAFKSILGIVAALTIGAAGVLTLTSGATITGDIIPTSDSTYTLGSVGKEYSQIYLDSASLAGTALKQPYTYIVAASGGDYASVSSAVAACPSTGCDIYVRGGTYTETVPATIAYSNTNIRLSQNATIQVNGASVPTYFIGTSGTSRIRIEGGKLLQTNATAQGVAIDMSNVSNSWIEKMRIEEFGTAVKYSDTASTTFYNSVSNMQLFNNNNCLEYSGSQANNNNVYNVRCRPKAGGAGIGLNVVDTRGLTVVGSDFEPSTGTGITGVSIDATSREITLVNCWIENNATGLSIASGANRVTVLGSSITSNSTDISDSGTGTMFLNTNDTGVNVTSFGANVTFNASVIPASVAADPCGTYGNSSFFYNGTAGVPCYCNNAGADLKVSDDSACF